METRPSALLEAVVGACLPASRRDEILDDLHERFQSPTQYWCEALGAVVCVDVNCVTRFLVRGIQWLSRLSHEIESDSLALCRALGSSMTICLSAVLWSTGVAFGVRRGWHPLVVMAPVWFCGFVGWTTRQQREPVRRGAGHDGSPT
jgi:hypothetical protein